MVPKVIWTEPAVEDLEEIHAFIRRDSPVNADLTIQRILAVTDEVKEFPLSGRIVPEFRRNTLREVVFGSYRVVYRISRGTIQILRVSHSARILKLRKSRFP